MGLFGFFKSKEERFRIHVRACFDESVKNVIKEKGDTVKHPLFGGMMIQTAIGSIYQTMKDDPTLYTFSLKTDFDPYQILEEEYKRAMNKYLE